MSYQKFTKNIGLLALTQIILTLSGITLLPIITKILGAENYGVWTQLVITIGMISPIASLGLPYTLVRFLPAEKDKKEIQDGIWSVFTILLFISVIVSLSLLCFSGPISHFLRAPKIFVQLLAFIIIFDYSGVVFFNVFRAFQQIKEYCFFIIFQEIMETGLIILTVFMGYGLLGAILSLLIAKIIVFSIMGSLIVKRVGVKIPEFLRIKRYLSFGLPNVLGDTSGWIIQLSDRYFLGFFWGALFVGYYAPAYTLSFCISYFMGPLSFLLAPMLSQHYDENRVDEVKKYINYSLKYYLILAIPSFFGLSILAKKILTYLSTPEIAQHSYFIVPLITFVVVLTGIYSIVSYIIGLKKKTHLSGAILLTAALLNLVLNLVLIPRLAILGAAISTFLTYFFVFALFCYYSYREIHFDVDWKSIFKSVLASILMSIFVLWLNPQSFYNTISTIIMAALLYFILIFLFKSFSKRETEFMKRFLKEFIKKT